MKFLKDLFKDIIETAKKDPKAKTRYIILILGLLFLADYLMFCGLTQKNVFDIIPSIPKLLEKKKGVVYLVSIDAKQIITEERNIPKFNNKDSFVKHLFKIVVYGSRFDNTSQIVPLKMFVRKVWFHKAGNKMHCYIDVDPGDITSDIIPNSEKQFMVALNKTIKKNIPEITSVSLLDKGIPVAALWEQ